jgi:ferredoxin-NADP reductase
MFTETSWQAVRSLVRLADAAATPHGIDRYIEQVAPTWSTTEVRGRVVSVRRQTHDTVTLTIQANRNWTGFRAGQHTQLTVEIDGVRHTRCYSMANSAVADRRRLELTIKAQPDGVVSNFLVQQAKPGLVVGLSPAGGDFIVPTGLDRPLLLISGGSGITPVLAMLRTLCDQGHRGPITFVHYALRMSAMTYPAELDQLAREHPGVRLVRILTEEPGAGDLDGFADEAQMDAIDADWRQAEAYLCGPAPLMDAMTSIYEKAGVSARLHTEAFTLARVLSEAGPAGGTLRFAATGTEVANDGRPVLSQAEAAGLRPLSGCRMGICHSCSCPLVSGTVADAVSGDLTSATGADVRICVSVPVGDVVVDL